MGGGALDLKLVRDVVYVVLPVFPIDVPDGVTLLVAVDGLLMPT